MAARRRMPTSRARTNQATAAGFHQLAWSRSNAGCRPCRRTSSSRSPGGSDALAVRAERAPQANTWTPATSGESCACGTSTMAQRYD